MATLEEFTSASLRGTYALTNIGRGGWAPCASIGILHFDGRGGITGTISTNLPGRSFQERVLLRGSVAGTYTVDADGSGFGSTIMAPTYSDGSTAEISSRFTINQVQIIDSVPTAQRLTFIQEKLDSITGSLNTAFVTRLPDAGQFTLASIKGTYSGVGFGRDGQTPVTGMGFITYDGNGNTNASNTQNFPGASFSERIFVTFVTPNGRYTVNEDGTGTITSAQEYETGAVADLVITSAKVIDNIKVAQEYFFILRDLLPTGSLATSVIYKRLPD